MMFDKKEANLVYKNFKKHDRFQISISIARNIDSDGNLSQQLCTTQGKI